MSTATYMLTEAINHWQYIEPYAKVPATKKEYRKQRLLLDTLMQRVLKKEDKHVANLLKLIARNLKEYEESYFALEKSTPNQVLEFLMQEHGLTQMDLPEIGSQSLVSKILKGERNLTAEHIARLANRFHISPAVFY